MKQDCSIINQGQSECLEKKPMESDSPASSSKETPPVLEAECSLLDDPDSRFMEPRSEMPVLTLSSPNALEAAAAAAACTIQGEEQLVKLGKMHITWVSVSGSGGRWYQFWLTF